MKKRYIIPFYGWWCLVGDEVRPIFLRERGDNPPSDRAFVLGFIYHAVLAMWLLVGIVMSLAP